MKTRLTLFVETEGDFCSKDCDAIRIMSVSGKLSCAIFHPAYYSGGQLKFETLKTSGKEVLRAPECLQAEKAT